MQTSVNPALVLHSGFLADKGSTVLKIKPLSNWPAFLGPGEFWETALGLWIVFSAGLTALPCAPLPLGSGRIVKAQMLSLHTRVALASTAGTGR